MAVPNCGCEWRLRMLLKKPLLLFTTDCLTAEVRAEKIISLFVTNHGEEVMARRPMFWTASSLRQFACDISGSHAWLAYDRIGLTYSCRMLSFVLLGMGLELFRIEYSIIPRMAVAFLIVHFMCAKNVRFLSRVTSRYLDFGDQGIWRPFIFRWWYWNYWQDRWT